MCKAALCATADGRFDTARITPDGTAANPNRSRTRYHRLSGTAPPTLQLWYTPCLHQQHHACRAVQCCNVTAMADGQLHVAAIGAGVAGIATCKALSVRGIPCTVFDPKPRVGGLWVANYPGARVQPRPGQFAFPDMDFPKVEGRLASAAEVCALCEAYVREWGLEGRLRLGTRVERVSQRAGGGFTVTTRPAQADSGGAHTSADFSHVVICAGVFSNKPRMPNWPGLAGFQGTPPRCMPCRRAPMTLGVTDPPPAPAAATAAA